jgi:methyltransferase
MSQLVVVLVSLVAVVAMMLGELRLSRAHERALLARGAVEPPDPAYSAMRWAYPGAFVAMALEGLAAPGPPGAAAAAGAALLLAAKALKYWAIASLGSRWTYRVLVLPGAPLVRSGPYRLLRHPNYVGVIGEMAGMALLVSAPVSGLAGTAFFALLLWRRVRSEEQAHRTIGRAAL